MRSTLLYFVISSFLIIEINSVYHDRYKNRMLSLKPALSTSYRFADTNEVAAENDCEYGICEMSSSYPKHRIAELIAKSKETHSFFGSIIEPQKSVNDFISNRNGFVAKTPESFCQSRIVTKWPATLTDLEGKTWFIANIEGVYQQAITFEVCVYEQMPCLLPSLSLNYQTTCTQRRNLIKLLAYDTDRDKLSFRTFPIFSTCLCTYLKSLK